MNRLSWLLIFYSIPSKPVGNRVRLWRRLSKAGALQLKGAVYILPYMEEHYEFCQWLMAEVSAGGGDGDFIVTDKLEMLNEADIIVLFNRQKEVECRSAEKTIVELEMKLESIKKGTRTKDKKAIQTQIDKLTKDFAEIKKTDFFSSPIVAETGKRINRLLKEVEKVVKLSKSQPDKTIENLVQMRNPGEYRKKIWITRKRPFVDRMACAWLIRRFIDSEPVFRFIDEHKVEQAEKGYVTFDIQGGEFTHTADMCTFEVLMRSFGITDRAVKKIAEIVHELDMKDDKYRSADAQGIEKILAGIRKTGKDDADILEKGISVFEMLYASKT